MRDAPTLDPLKLLVDWHREAHAIKAREPDAMTLATATPDGRPSARVVLLKGIERGELSFVTNYQSKKGLEIEQNPQVALLFFWPELMRQVRVEGRARRAAASESDAYFRSRPRESQLGAWASAQSSPLESREALIQSFEEADARFRGRDVERPLHWGMYWVTPERVELWIAGEHRLHDRFDYVREGAGWSVTRLSP